MKTILLVNASPRAQGNSEVITQILAEDLKDQRVVVFTMREKDCRYCKACGACQGTAGQSCVQDDDITKLLPVIEACDAIVVATPIYNQQISSLAKLFIERFYPWFDFDKKGMSNTAKYGKIRQKSGPRLLLLGQPQRQGKNICRLDSERLLPNGSRAVPNPHLQPNPQCRRRKKSARLRRTGASARLLAERIRRTANAYSHIRNGITGISCWPGLHGIISRLWYSSG